MDFLFLPIFVLVAQLVVVTMVVVASIFCCVLLMELLGAILYFVLWLCYLIATALGWLCLRVVMAMPFRRG
jgi:hypothetical protein